MRTLPERDAERRANETAGPRVSPARRGALARVGRKPDRASIGEESVTESRYNANSLRADVLTMRSRCTHDAYRLGRMSRGLDRSCPAASLVRAFLPPTLYCPTIPPHGAYIGSLGPARVGATAGEVDHPPVVGLARFFVQSRPRGRRSSDRSSADVFRSLRSGMYGQGRGVRPPRSRWRAHSAPGTRRSRGDAGRRSCGPSVRRAPAGRSHRNHVVAGASAGHALAAMVDRAVSCEDDAIGRVVRAVGSGAEQEHFGHGAMLAQPGGRRVGAVRQRRQCVGYTGLVRTA